jgi:hypothetical protein
LAPGTAPFLIILAPESLTRNPQNGAVSGAINRRDLAIS